MHRVHHTDDGAPVHQSTYSQRYFVEDVPKLELPTSSMPADAAYQLVHDELALDGNPLLNLASFVTTWMEPEARRLVEEALDKNLVDKDEYPKTNAIHRRVINMVARLLNAPADLLPVGTATVGSSEAIMLGLLAHKFAWRKRRQAEGKPVDRPNMVIGACVHTSWEKAARYFDIEARMAPIDVERRHLTAAEVESRIDENTVAVGAVLGNTFTGELDDIAGIDELLRSVKEERGLDIPIHVDAASGGFVAPFAAPDHVWDFRLEHVRSINVSNHKFGLVYPGMGSVVFRDQDCVPEELVFHITYLGGDSPTYSLNFSQASLGVIAQYYNFLRLGREGYERIMRNAIEVAEDLERRLLEAGPFGSMRRDTFMPVVAVHTTNGHDLSLYDLSERLRERGWIVPAYPLPANAQDITVLRMVVKENFGRDMAEDLAGDVHAVVDRIEGRRTRAPREHGRTPRPIC